MSEKKSSDSKKKPKNPVNTDKATKKSETENPYAILLVGFVWVLAGLLFVTGGSIIQHVVDVREKKSLVSCSTVNYTVEATGQDSIDIDAEQSAKLSKPENKQVIVLNNGGGSGSIGCTWCAVIAIVLQNIGMAMFVLGLFNIMLGYFGWQAFFEKLFKRILTDKDYLKGLNQSELKQIQIEFYKQLTGREDIDHEKSFFTYFSKNLVDLMIYPYREYASSSIVYMEHENKLFAFETLEYTCRMGKSSFESDEKHIQQDIKYFADSDDFESLLEILIEIKLPEEETYTKYENDDEVQAMPPQNAKTESTPAEGNHQKPHNVPKKNSSPFDLSPSGAGWQKLCENSFDSNEYVQGIDPVPLEKYSMIDGLKIRIQTIYIPNIDAVQIWGMANPTYHLDLNIAAPEGYKVIRHSFVPKQDVSDQKKKNTPHIATVKIDSWLLPSNGIAFRIVKSK